MKSKTVVLTFLSLLFHGQAFMNPSFTNKRYHSKSTGRSSRSWTEKLEQDTTVTTSSRMMMIVPTFSDLTITMNSFNIGASGMLISSDQDVEAQIFGDVAHLILDFATICSPDTVLLRLLIFVGRICSIMSDYLPDHTMTYDELVFQSTMLAISTKMFLKKFATIISSLNESTSFKDLRIYKSVFYPAGFSWIQYKTLLAMGVLRWDHCNPGMYLLEDQDSLLITYKGEINHLVNGFPFARYGMCEGKFCHDIIGDFSQSPEFLDTKRKKSFKQQQRDGEKDIRILRAEQTGATLLRIDTKKLLEYAREDIDIAESTKNLYFNAMQKTISSYSEYPPMIGNGTDTQPLIV